MIQRNTDDAITIRTGVERLRLDLEERVLDDRVVGAPDDGHQEQQGVDAGHKERRKE
jgi:hypothetical protein